MALPLLVDVFTHLKALQNPYYRYFYGGFITQSWSIVNSILGLSPLYREVEDRAEKFKFLIMAWSFGDQGFPGGSEMKNLPAKQETLQVWSLGWEDLMEMEMSTHPGFLPGKSHGQRRLAGYSPRGCKRVRHDSATEQQQRSGEQPPSRNHQGATQRGLIRTQDALLLLSLGKFQGL